MDVKKTGDLIHSLPVDPKQDTRSVDMNFIHTLKKKTLPQNTPPPMQEDTDSDSDEEEDDVEEEVVAKPKEVSLWSEIKSTFLASLIYVLLSMEMVDGLIRKTGLDGLNLALLKLFLFATIYFVLRYKFM